MRLQFVNLTAKTPKGGAMHRVIRPSRASWLGMVAGAALIVSMPLAALGAASTTVEVLADSYGPKTFSIDAGTTVEFKNVSTFPHTATADDGSFDTGLIAAGASKSITLSTAGSFAFHCQFHGAAGGVGQSGIITVTAAAATPVPTTTSGEAAPTSGPAKPRIPPPSDMLPDLPGGIGGLTVIAFGTAAISSIILAVVADSVRGAARRRPGR